MTTITGFVDKIITKWDERSGGDALYNTTEWVDLLNVELPAVFITQLEKTQVFEELDLNDSEKISFGEFAAKICWISLRFAPAGRMRDIVAQDTSDNASNKSIRDLVTDVINLWSDAAGDDNVELNESAYEALLSAELPAIFTTNLANQLRTQLASAIHDNDLISFAEFCAKLCAIAVQFSQSDAKERVLTVTDGKPAGDGKPFFDGTDFQLTDSELAYYQYYSWKPEHQHYVILHNLFNHTVKVLDATSAYAAKADKLTLNQIIHSANYVARGNTKHRFDPDSDIFKYYLSLAKLALKTPNDYYTRKLAEQDSGSNQNSLSGNSGNSKGYNPK